MTSETPKPTRVLGPPAVSEQATDSAAQQREHSAVTVEFSQHSIDALPTHGQVAAASGATRQFGRYSVKRLLGTGGFGSVYVAHDPQLHRDVAIKVARPDRIRPGNVEQFLQEARRMARLDHDGILRVFDVGEVDGQCYIVTQLIDGVSLNEWLEANRPRWDQAAELAAAIADALSYAHAQRIVHRDVKPRNILLNRELKPILADFGLAIADEEANDERCGMVAGTIPYLSPEQARGEGHRIDGRTDIYSLGVVLYQMLCGRLPFSGTTRGEIMRQLREDEPQPPRQLNRDVPPAVERVCLKALAKRCSDRYSSAADMAEDLRHALAVARLDGSVPATGRSSHAALPGGTTALSSVGVLSESRNVVRIVPKGLRSFGPEDSEFFLELLPGPRDRLGLPDSLRFWKLRIEDADPEGGFSVGLIYGPSGCGKSSLVRAGLLPRLDASVRPIFIEATRDETEVRLDRALRRAYPEFQPGASLAGMLAQFRRAPAGRAPKLLIVIDQFEQWLHVHGRDLEQSDLADAIRQADGQHVQVLLLVRDDFWLGVTRLFDYLELKLDRDRNARCVDLFDAKHARRVLAAFGHAFDRLPERRDELTPDQARFIEQSVGELSQDGRVVPVRLSLFAELMKTRAWTPATLVEVGGTEGVGVRFLEESFTSRAAVPETRALEKHARAVLLTLLPEAGAEIKGQMRSRAELAAGCGLPADSQQLARLLEILDRELHIVTPVEPLESVGAAGERAAATSPASRDEQSFYQLTHDYLVPPLRQWLLLERRKSWRGRAEICLEERAGQMSRWPQSRYLPSLREFFAILLAVPGSRQKPDERALMYAARRHFVTRGVALLLVVASVGGIAGTTWRNYVTSQREHYATDLVARLLVADSDRAAEIIRDARTQGAALAEAVRKALARDDLTPTQRLHLSLTVRAIDPRQDAYVRERILAATPKELELLRAELQPSGPELLEFLVQTLRNRGSPQDHRLRAACILAAIDANHEAWRDAATDVAAELVSQDPLSAHQWVQLLRPARKWLAPVLEEVHFGSEQRRDSLVAAMALAEYAGDDLPGLLKLLDRANDEQIAVLARRVGSIGPSGAAALSNKATILAPSATTSDERETAARQQARAAAALLHVAPDAELAWAAFRHGPDPTARSWLIQLTAASGVPVERIIRRLSTEPDESSRRALIHVLGRYRDESLPPAAREQLINHLLKLYSDYADPGVHFSAQWLLRTWGQQHRMDEIDMAATSGAPVDSRRWYRTKSGHEMVLIPTPITFFMGSPASERGRHTSEKLPQPMEIAYRFAVAAKEVTIEQYRLFMPEHRAGVARSSDWPVTQVSLYDAARFCNWLSEQEGLPPEQMCYEMNDAERAHLVPAFQSRRGFRLPLLHEAECAARSGTVTSRHFGSSDELLVYYDRFLENSSLQPAPVGSYLPNDFGLFDTLGNVAEWSHGPDETVPQRGYRRGGSYNLPSEWLRSAQVVGFRSDGPSDSVGFRVVQGWP